MNSDRWKVGREESTQRGRPARQRSVPVKQRKRSHYGEKAAPLNRLTASQARGPSLEEFQLTEIRTSSRPIPVHSAGAIGGLVPSDVNMRARADAILLEGSTRTCSGELVRRPLQIATAVILLPPMLEFPGFPTTCLAFVDA